MKLIYLITLFLTTSIAIGQPPTVYGTISNDTGPIMYSGYTHDFYFSLHCECDTQYVSVTDHSMTNLDSIDVVQADSVGYHYKITPYNLYYKRIYVSSNCVKDKDTIGLVNRQFIVVRIPNPVIRLGSFNIGNSISKRIALNEMSDYFFTTSYLSSVFPPPVNYSVKIDSVQILYGKDTIMQTKSNLVSKKRFTSLKKGTKIYLLNFYCSSRIGSFVVEFNDLYYIKKSRRNSKVESGQGHDFKVDPSEPCSG